MKKVIYTTDAPAPIGPYSQAIYVNNILFVSGQIALDAKTEELVNNNIEVETEKILNNIKAILKAAEMDFTNIIKTSIFLTDMANFPKVNEVYGKFFIDTFPARETVEVSALPKSANIEISVIAV